MADLKFNMKTNAYIEVLRYGSNYEAVNPQTLVDHLNERKLYFYPDHISNINTTAFKNAFMANYIAGDGSRPDFRTGKPV